MSWLFFAIAAPALYGITNFLDKFLVEKRAGDPILLATFSGLVTFVLGVIILSVTRSWELASGAILTLMVTGTCSVLANLPYYKAMQLDEASRIVPLFEIIPVFVLIISHFFLGETLAPIQFVAFFLILAGGFILSVDSWSYELFKIRRSFWYMMLASLLTAILLVGFKSVVKGGVGFWQAFGWQFIGGGVGVILLILVYGRRSKEKAREVSLGTLGLMFSQEGCYFLARICGFFATVLASVSLVSVLGGLQSFFVLIYGIVLSLWLPHILREDMKGSTIALKFGAIMLIFIGVYLINA